MTLAERFLPELSSWKTDRRDTLTAQFPTEGWMVRLVAEHSDVVGVLAWELTVERSASAPEGCTVRAWAETIASRSSGLMERIKLLEVDDERSQALLRSDHPTAKGNEVGYYEIRLDGTRTATLRRFVADRVAGTPREQVPFTVTRDALLKLIDDISNP